MVPESLAESADYSSDIPCVPVGPKINLTRHGLSNIRYCLMKVNMYT